MILASFVLLIKGKQDHFEGLDQVLTLILRQERSDAGGTQPRGPI